MEFSGKEILLICNKNQKKENKSLKKITKEHSFNLKTEKLPLFT